MNKQQLASTIWQSANQMRSKIEANEYKDYILGFMFYKYLSDREVSFLKGEKYSDEDIKKVTANDEKLVKHISENIGYFIAYEDLFSTWLSKGDDFDVSDVRDALSNHIEAIIGLPANIFFGTGIPTIIMVLKRTRSDSDVLIIDASKKFEKAGKNNKLRARDIREIVDTLKARKSVTKFAKLVTKDDIRKNEYNLNIPRYVDSSDDEEPSF